MAWGGQVSIFGYIYSFGILLLEIFTRRQPTDDMFKGGLSIHQFATMAMPNHAMDIVDPSLLIECEDAHGDRIPVHARRLEECSVLMMQIGLSCSAISPS